MFARYPLVRNFSACSTRRGVAASPSRAGSSPSCASRALIRSCILLLYISGAARVFGQAEQPADALYAHREDLPSARRAADLWRVALDTEPRNFDAAWKLARANYWLGGHA